MNKNFGTYFGVRAVLPALFTFTAASVLSVASARADTTFSDFAPNGSSTASPSDFTASATLGVSGNDSVSGSSGDLLITDNNAGSGQSILTFTLNNTGGGTITLTSLEYTYGFSGEGATVDWNLNGSDLGSTPITILQDNTIDLTAAGANATGTSFTLIGTLSLPAPLDEVGFNSFTIDPVPEPVNYALAGFGLIFVGGIAGKTLRRKLSAVKTA